MNLVEFARIEKAASIVAVALFSTTVVYPDGRRRRFTPDPIAYRQCLEQVRRELAADPEKVRVVLEGTPTAGSRLRTTSRLSKRHG